jgi:putative acetyltransferase
MSEISICREREGDVSAIRNVIVSAFGGEAEADLVEIIRKNNKHELSLVAIQSEQIVGHIFFTPASIYAHGEKSELRVVALGPLTVLPSHHSMGIGSQLVREGLAICRNSGYEIMIVMGKHQFYRRFGFAPARDYALRFARKTSEDLWLVTELQNHKLHNLCGIAKYLTEFDIL